ncbi:peptidase M23 [Actinoplanes sp. SE50]|uniref:peptidoglycan DD-metalloendopeptidase family protein n=1 Tax=unclassified Actinoplanes TaxID=2626549 RepID=UPI00023EC72E|nr:MULTISPECIES: M23 family metallopeptidase [unclassified Actinoplanes]AEV81978.1 Pyruvate decarboxylase isozyme 2 [Actinoplanes sp. SE50/110]ATO80378.1 peptidase M23 [Actinoplanes sp. SE50]SLL97784.1 peptidase M23 [Actinoplanes sp. SE50/110]
MRYRRLDPLLTACLCLLAAVGLTLAVPAPASADQNDAAEAAQSVRRAEALLENAGAAARAAARRLAVAAAAMPEAQHRVATARGIVIATRVEADTARTRADAARQSYQTIAADWTAAEQRVAGARERVAQIARNSYMGSPITRLNLLVSAHGPVDLMDRMSMVDEMVRQENDDVRRLIGARREARAAQDRAGAAKRAAEVAEAEAAAKLQEAQTAQVDAVRAKRDVYQLVLARRAALSAANAQRATVLAQYRAAVAEERKIRSSMAGWEVRSGYSGQYHGRLLMPVHGWKSSDYGNRYDPYYRVWQLHAGTDFAAGSGTPIRAAAAGRVIQAGWHGGYGNYTCVNHGRVMGIGFSTCYGHQSRIYVHVGEYVRQGEIIGLVGSTGASTGSHLHFETRFGGAPRNPLNYLPPCLC